MYYFVVLIYLLFIPTRRSTYLVILSHNLPVTTVSSVGRSDCAGGDRRHHDHPLAPAVPLRDQIVRRPYRSEEHTSVLQSPCNIVCRLLLEKTNNILYTYYRSRS